MLRAVFPNVVAWSVEEGVRWRLCGVATDRTWPFKPLSPAGSRDFSRTVTQQSAHTKCQSIHDKLTGSENTTHTHQECRSGDHLRPLCPLAASARASPHFATQGSHRSETPAAPTASWTPTAASWIGAGSCGWEWHSSATETVAGAAPATNTNSGLSRRRAPGASGNNVLGLRLPRCEK